MYTLSNIRNKEEIKEIVIFVRLNLYNKMVPCGAKAIKEQMKSMDVEPLPSISKINRILKDNYLTHQRMGYSPEDYRKHYLHYQKHYVNTQKKWYRDTFLKLEWAYGTIYEVIFCKCYVIKRFIKFLWKKVDAML